MASDEVLHKTVDGIEYTFQHGRCFCFSHCNVDTFTMGEQTFLINEANADACDLTQAAFKDSVHRIVQVRPDHFRIWLEDDDPVDEFLTL